MITHNLNYYSKICSKITIYDNESTDDSREIIKRYNDSNDDTNIVIKNFDTHGEHREDMMVNVRNNCWKGSTADYVIVCDMDEFLFHESLIEKLIEAKNKEIAIPVIIGYNMMASVFPSNYKELITSQIQYGFRDRMFDKNIIFDPKKVKNINYGPGSHSCSPEFYTEEYKQGLLELKLLHYKYIDKDYLYKRHETYANRMSDVNNENRWGYEYNLGDDHIDQIYKLKYYLIKIV
ncbi:glycosyltransferase family 2 protein [Kordia sp.]|uniref:glycosyltransferase family 2 protein n=1 Tax=Kordia sp. TaxID=1965332 RepID=UPI003B5A2FD8